MTSQLNTHIIFMSTFNSDKTIQYHEALISYQILSTVPQTKMNFEVEALYELCPLKSG